VSLAMTKQERETFLADLHVGIISIAEEGRGPLTVPIWYTYEPGGELRVVTGRTSRKAQLLRHAGRFSICVQTETWPYKYVSVEGPVVAIEPADVERDRRPLAHRYFGAQKGGPIHREDTIRIRWECGCSHAARTMAHGGLREGKSAMTVRPTSRFSSRARAARPGC
jgi:hypothetical protein